jgi:hypothetical protein
MRWISQCFSCRNVHPSPFSANPPAQLDPASCLRHVRPVFHRALWVERDVAPSERPALSRVDMNCKRSSNSAKPPVIRDWKQRLETRVYTPIDSGGRSRPQEVAATPEAAPSHGGAQSLLSTGNSIQRQGEWTAPSCLTDHPALGAAKAHLLSTESL